MPDITSTDSILYSRLLLGKARHLLVKARQKELAPYLISPRQAAVLTVIDELGEKANLTELAEHTDRNINTLSIQITRMENDGLVIKVRETPKSNKLRFELTEKGRNACKEVKKINSLNIIMSALTEAERQQLISLLEKIINKAQEIT
jgi:DNA-binding MarR family transcriptional regulator